MYRRIAGIDVHKRVLMVAIGVATFQKNETSGETEPQEAFQFEMRRFGTTTTELEHLAGWLQHHGVEEVVMESTAQYWKPVWLGLEPYFRLNMAQAWSNRAPKGKKTDFKDAQRLVRRHLAGELTLSFIPEVPNDRCAQWRGGGCNWCGTVYESRTRWNRCWKRRGSSCPV
jgi:transposase